MGEIATIRKKRSRHYTTLGNELLRDARLSWKARGLFCYLWSHSDNFRFSIEKLTTKASDGRDSTASGLAELQKLGYLVIERVRGPKGRFIRATWTLTEDPESFVSSASTPYPENPDVVAHHERETGVPVKPSRTTEALSRRTGEACSTRYSPGASRQTGAVRSRASAPTAPRRSWRPDNALLSGRA
ncbi:hypothetical protein GCM10007164_11110 [Luteimonas padinae]|uniref:Helix-turn-helix domain-containing protein n=1 Tax=Luteimonas padinae TaxID=1714359 RepID=A0ABV6SSY2_9GAMM|nr:helix-turn-helix domain-containing protein [Luteimonas padinae]GHD68874.1 hypothetical protein GCM10007164_11110 [Luteimonas padinae]